LDRTLWLFLAAGAAEPRREAGRLVAGLLFGVSASDAWILAGAAAVLLATALAATWAPARRAARIEPVRALRYE
jgi:ABC-type lipoprotein release transport system permease subunit